MSSNISEHCMGSALGPVSWRDKNPERGATAEALADNGCKDICPDRWSERIN